MQNIIKRIAVALAGMIMTLAVWSFIGGNAGSEVQGIPSKVWEGGGGMLNVEVNSTTPARFSIGFDGEGEDLSLDAWTPVAAGSHTWTINIPREAGGYIELSAENPKVGDKLSWKIHLNGRLVDEQSETLEQALDPGYGFFLQSYYDDYSSIPEFGVEP
jgi:hypothetical protein